MPEESALGGDNQELVEDDGRTREMKTDNSNDDAKNSEMSSKTSRKR